MTQISWRSYINNNNRCTNLNASASLEIEEEVDKRPHEFGSLSLADEAEEGSGRLDELGEFFGLALLLIELAKLEDALLLDTNAFLVILADNDPRVRDDLVQKVDTLGSIGRRRRLRPLEQHRAGHSGFEFRSVTLSSAQTKSWVYLCSSEWEVVFR